MTHAEFKHHFELSFTQYDTMDRFRCERFGTLVQGFVGVMTGNNAKICPFQFVWQEISESIDKIWNENSSLILESDYVGISFVQHYIHYG